MNIGEAVHAAIELYQNAAFQVAEIEDEIAERNLASEVCALLIDRLEE